MSRRTSTHAHAVVAMALLAVVGCSDPKPTRPAGGGEPGAEGAVKEAEASAAKQSPAVEKGQGTTSPTPEDLEALVGVWLKAQNAGDFPAYEKLYAGKFGGVKRAGRRTYRFDRKGWLEDRRRMFERPMVVTAAKLEITPGARSALIEFEQGWSSGKFEDVGPKRLLVVVEGEELKIAREEMLRSAIGKLKYGKASGAGDFYFLVDGNLVLHDATIPEVNGPLTLHEGDPMVVDAPVKPQDLDEATRSWLGRKVRVDRTCEAVVTGFRAVSRVVPHFGDMQYWNCTMGDPDCVKTPESEQAAELYRMGSKALVADLEGCAAGTYARPAEQPRVIVGKQVSDAALISRAKATFGARSEVTDQQKPNFMDWWKGQEQVVAFEHPESGQRLVSVHAAAGDGCGSPAGDGWMAWSVEGDELAESEFAAAPLKVRAAVDVNGDGTLELIVDGDYFGTEKMLVDSKTLEPLLTLEYSFQDCGC